MSPSFVRAGVALVALAAMASHGHAQSAPRRQRPRRGHRSSTPSNSSWTRRRSAARRSRPTRRASCSPRTRPASSTPTRCRSAAASATPVTTSTTDRPTPSSSSPTDDRVLFTRDQGGNELNHLYVHDADGKEQRPDAGREAQGPVRRLVARRHGLLRPDQRAGPAILRPLPLRRDDATSGRSSTRTSPATAGRHLARRQVGRAGEAEHHQRHRHLPVERRPAKRLTHHAAHRATRSYEPGGRSTRRRSTSTT